MGKKLTTEDWINKAKERRGDTYTYEKSIYTGSNHPIIVTCVKHGDVNVRADSHLASNGNGGCKLCAHINQAGSIRLNHDDVISKFKETHGDKYNYSKMVYMKANEDVTIVCQIHGDFKQQPSNHIRGGGCPTCARVSQRTRVLGTKEDFIRQASEIHDDRYDYSNVKYNGIHSYVDIVCPEHGEFTQKVRQHIHGKQSGCPYCADFGFDLFKPAILYYLKLHGGSAYKIGITGKGIEKRFEKYERDMFEVLETWDFVIGEDALKMEQRILKEYKWAKYKGEPLLNSGNTELFDRDVLGLDV